MEMHEAQSQRHGREKIMKLAASVLGYHDTVCIVSLNAREPASIVAYSFSYNAMGAVQRAVEAIRPFLMSATSDWKFHVFTPTGLIECMADGLEITKEQTEVETEHITESK